MANIGIKDVIYFEKQGNPVIGATYDRSQGPPGGGHPTRNFRIVKYFSHFNLHHFVIIKNLFLTTGNHLINIFIMHNSVQ